MRLRSSSGHFWAHRSVARLVVAAFTAALVLSACSDNPSADDFEHLPTPSESPAPVPSPTPSPDASGGVDVTTTPDEITLEWVTAVVNTLLAEYGEMTAEILRMPVADDPTLPQGFEEQLDQLFDGEYLERRLAELMELRTDGAERQELLPPDQFGGLRFEAHLVQRAEPSCVVAVGRLSQRLTIPDGGPVGQLSAISLSPATTDTHGSNPTEWAIVDELLNVDKEFRAMDDEVMLNATIEDYGAALEHTCGESS